MPMASDVMKARLYGDCLLVAPAGSGPAGAVLDNVVMPAWSGAGGYEKPGILTLSAADKDAMRRLADARVVFIDITGADPAAIYWLGVRDALARLLTIPLCRGAVPALPHAARVIAIDKPGDAVAKIRQRLEDLRHKDDEFQSPVAQAIPGLKVTTRTPQPLGGSVIHLRSIAAPGGGVLPTRIGVLWGDLAEVRGVDVWVNSENSFMEMGRMFDPGVSGLIRRLGAKGPAGGDYTEDCIQRELMMVVGSTKRPVEDGSVFWTGPGNLARRGVKAIAHVAAVGVRKTENGEFIPGYVPVRDLGRCVTNVLDEIEAGQSLLARAGRLQWAPFRSVLFPLMGTGSARAEARVVSSALIATAIDHLRSKPSRFLERVLFLAYSDVDRDLCLAALDAFEGVSADQQ